MSCAAAWCGVGSVMQHGAVLAVSNLCRHTRDATKSAGLVHA